MNSARGGSRPAVNPADYDESHVHRLRLITILVGVGGLSVADVRYVLAAVDDASATTHEVLGVAHRAIALPR